jgi:hypothetical protein
MDKDIGSVDGLEPLRNVPPWMKHIYTVAWVNVPRWTEHIYIVAWDRNIVEVIDFCRCAAGYSCLLSSFFCLQASCQMNYCSCMRWGVFFCFVNIRYLMCTRALLSNYHLIPIALVTKFLFQVYIFLLYLGTFQLRISLLTYIPYIPRPWCVQILYTQISSTLGNLSSIFSNFLYLVSLCIYAVGLFL